MIIKLCDVCIGIFNPVKLKIKTTRHYPIIVDPPQGSFIGLRDRYRGLCLIKNRNGEPDKYCPVNFFGEINLWRDLPKGEEVTNWIPYLYLDQEIEDIKEEKKDVAYSYSGQKQLIYDF